jgi:hypothetical protein
MSKDEIHSIATVDTPSDIQIPNTWQGLIVWAVARFGVGLIVAAVFCYGIITIYADMRTDRTQLMDAYRDNTKAIEQFGSRLAEQTKAIEEAHRRAEK